MPDPTVFELPKRESSSHEHDWRGDKCAFCDAKNIGAEATEALTRSIERETMPSDVPPSDDSDPRLKIVELVMQHHLPLKLPDDAVMCMCHLDENDGMVFTGPVFHRRHVAAKVVEWIDRGEPEPSLFDDAYEATVEPRWRCRMCDIVWREDELQQIQPDGRDACPNESCGADTLVLEATDGR